MTHPNHDFETYSEAGHVWQEAGQKWVSPKGAGAKRKGLPIVGSAAYAEHPSTEVLTFSYDLKDGHPCKRRWRPGEPNPQPLFDHLARGGLLEAHNVIFEFFIWEYVCVPKYGWPSLLPYVDQLRCSMATARVNSLPGKLEALADVLGTHAKDTEGKRLLDKFSSPRNPTKTDPRRRIAPPGRRPPPPPLEPRAAAKRDALHAADDADFERLHDYNDTDLDAESGAAGRMTPMSADELEFWLIDQEINRRGVGVDTVGVANCIAVLEQALEQYGDEHRALTGGLDPTQLKEVSGWLRAQGVYMASMKEEDVTDALARIPPPPPGHVYPPRRVLEIRSLIGSASVKKLYAMSHQATRDGRLKNLIVHHGARTGRPTGEGPQPLNLPKAGPDLFWCRREACKRPFRQGADACPWCGESAAGLPKRKWSAAACDYVLEIMAARSLPLVEWYFGDALLAISGCIRGLFIAAPGHELIASDYSAIEAVVTAELAGEEWRIEAFRSKTDIYLAGASKITGTPLQVYLDYAAQHGDHHPDRQKIGKVSELACGFGGWVGSYKAFGSLEPDDVIKAQILAWRDASPGIVEMWGGQSRGLPWDRDRRPDLFGFEGAAVAAIQNPGRSYTVVRGGKLYDTTDTPAQGIGFYMRGDALIVRLLSGRELTYHAPRLSPSSRDRAAPWEVSITYMTWNTNPKYGPMGWVPMSTYAGRLTENIVQAVAHDILRHAIKLLRAAGYACVLHVYDEIVVEVLVGTGSIEEVERIMATLPWWCAGWPVRASGGWRARRYRKG